jgi:hypothetical protein
MAKLAADATPLDTGVHGVGGGACVNMRIAIAACPMLALGTTKAILLDSYIALTVHIQYIRV